MRIAPIFLTILVGFVFQLSEARLIAQTQKPDSRSTLYQRLGAYDGISSYIALVFPRVAQHPELSHMFRGHGTDSQHRISERRCFRFCRSPFGRIRSVSTISQR